MAVKFISNYAKRLGLPSYSSHQFSVSVETELSDLEQAPAEIAMLYQRLQESVDREIQQTGFIPGEDYGVAATTTPARQVSPNGNGHSNGNSHQDSSANGDHSATANWQCSSKQRSLILDLQKRLGLSNADLDQRSRQYYSRPVHQLTKLSASNLISDLLEEADQSGRSQNGNPRPSTAR